MIPSCTCQPSFADDELSGDASGRYDRCLEQSDELAVASRDLCDMRPLRFAQARLPAEQLGLE
jgi:hypothetical protein